MTAPSSNHSATDPKRPLYFMHGLLGTARYHFAAQMDGMPPSSRLLAVDLPGHGSCQVDALPDDYFEQCMAYLVACVDRFGPGHFVAASYLGAPLAFRLAAAQPNKVLSIAALGFVPDLDPPLFATWVQGFFALAQDNPGLRDWYAAHHGERWHRTLEAYRTQIDRDYPASFAISSDLIAGLKVPVLILNGGNKSMEREFAASATRLGNHVSGVVVDGAGHIPSLDRPKQILACLQTFLP